LSTQKKYKTITNNTFEFEHDYKLNNVSTTKKNKGVKLVVANVCRIGYWIAYCMSIDKYVEGDGSSFATFCEELNIVMS
jgi:hypothetical protein